MTVPKFTIRLEKECTAHYTADVEVEAADRYEAERLAVQWADKRATPWVLVCTDGGSVSAVEVVGGEDDDFSEDDTPLADPETGK